MVKTLVTNGCSFVAGDAILWQQYLSNKTETFFPLYPAPNESLDEHLNQLRAQYKTLYRPRHNLPRMLSHVLGCRLIDLAEDAGSNQSIALRTVQFLLQIPREHRQNYHVVVGWTVLARTSKFSQVTNTFYNLNASMNPHDRNNPVLQELADYHRAFVCSYDQDYFADYVRNIIMLESFLQANGVTYTFYRSMGSSDDIPENGLGPLSFTGHGTIQHSDVTDNAQWYDFGGGDYAFTGNSWHNTEIEPCPANQINQYNGHPNLTCAQEWASKLSNFIKNQCVLDQNSL